MDFPNIAQQYADAVRRTLAPYEQFRQQAAAMMAAPMLAVRQAEEAMGLSAVREAQAAMCRPAAEMMAEIQAQHDVSVAEAMTQIRAQQQDMVSSLSRHMIDQYREIAMSMEQPDVMQAMRSAQEIEGRLMADIEAAGAAAVPNFADLFPPVAALEPAVLFPPCPTREAAAVPIFLPVVTRRDSDLEARVQQLEDELHPPASSDEDTDDPGPYTGQYL